jgi:PIN domain nuclease of toxin-antitoxin system
VLLLDTHIWIWSVEGEDRRVNPESQRRILRAESADQVRVSPVSLFEVTNLSQAGRLHFNRSIEQWIEGALHPSGIRLADLTAEIAIDAGHIPKTGLGDPMDRLLVATARRLDATFVTADRAILTYARGGHVRVHDASR